MSERDELKPCPFCGGEPGMVQQTKVNWAVMCHVCGAEGGWSNPSDAIALWNHRPTPPQAVPALVRADAFRDCIDAIKGAIAFGRQDTNPAPDGHWLAEFWEIGRQLAAAPTAPQAVPALTAKQRYDEFMEPGEEPSPIERLRFFCSLAMSGQDWLDVEPFFDDLLAAPQPSPEALTECAEIDPEAWKSLKAHAHDWRFSLQDHLYKCDCGETRGDYPFGAASFKD